MNKIVTVCILCVCAFSASVWSAKNTILIIGDGMGVQQLGLLSLYTRFATNNYPSQCELLAENGEMGLLLTYPAGGLVTDSAASGTQMATGQPALPRVVGIASNGTPARTVAEMARDQGKAVGLISDTRITHATPACFLAHWYTRDDENTIARQICHSDIDLLLSGGLRHWIPAACTNHDSTAYEDIHSRTAGTMAVTSDRNDDTNLLDIAESRGYSVVHTRAQLNAAPSGKILGLFASSGLPDGIEEYRSLNDPDRTVPTLNELMKTALSRLSLNTNGFFLMIEAGQIDWAGHANDAGHLLHEMFRLNDIVRTAREFAASHPRTVIIVTADHETGGVSLNYSPFDAPEALPLPGSHYSGVSYDPGYNYQDVSRLYRLGRQPRTYTAIVKEFMELPASNQSAKILSQMVTDGTGCTLSSDDAAEILTYVPNPECGARGKGTAYHPRIHDFNAFNPLDTEGRLLILIGRKLSRQLGISWATGTHSHSPVPVIASGSPEETELFTGIHHMTAFGAALQRCVCDDEISAVGKK